MDKKQKDRRGKVNYIWVGCGAYLIYLGYRVFSMTQVGIRPPHFIVFCNDARLFHFSYQRYLENCIRNTFGLEGTPIILSIRQKGDKEE